MTTPLPEPTRDQVFIVEPRNAPAYARYLVVDASPVRARPAMRLFRTGERALAAHVRDFWRRGDFSVYAGELRLLT